MIASGGLSGGISSSIAGGNFWDGARQGIITSGLNHLAHNGVLAYAKHRFQVEIDKAFGTDADQGVPHEKRNSKDVVLALEKVPTLKRLWRAFKGKVPIKVIDKYMSSYGGDAHVFSESYRENPLVPFDDPNITLFGASFSSYRYLSEVLLHEFGHVNSILSGNFCNTYNEMVRKFSGKSEGFIWSQTIYRDEIYAYKYAFDLGGVLYQGISGYQKAKNGIID